MTRNKERRIWKQKRKIFERESDIVGDNSNDNIVGNKETFGERAKPG